MANSPSRSASRHEEGARDAGGGRWSVEPDRRAAIGQALAVAGPGDAVVIAGKGHEAGQQLADRTIDFDDRTVARELLVAAGHGGETTP